MRAGTREWGQILPDPAAGRCLPETTLLIATRRLEAPTSPGSRMLLPPTRPVPEPGSRASGPSMRPSWTELSSWIPSLSIELLFHLSEEVLRFPATDVQESAQACARLMTKK